MFRRPAEFSGLDFCQVFPGGSQNRAGEARFVEPDPPRAGNTPARLRAASRAPASAGQSHLHDARAGGEAQLSGQLAAGASKTLISTALPRSE